MSKRKELTNAQKELNWKKGRQLDRNIELFIDPKGKYKL